MQRSAFSGTALVVALLISASTWAAPSNDPPPVGAILDLDGLSVPTSYTGYSVNFGATLSSTAITFAFRDDASFIYFSTASVIDTTTSSGNLLLNGGFSGGTNTQDGNGLAPVNWTYTNQYGAAAGGQVQSCGAASGYCWYDGAVQAYDAISQTIATTIGNTYMISFDAQAGPVGTSFSRLSTNGNVTDAGGNGIDILAYAQAGLPAASVPEPAGLLILVPGLLGLCALRRRAVRIPPHALTP